MYNFTALWFIRYARGTDAAAGKPTGAANRMEAACTYRDRTIYENWENNIAK